MGKIRTIKPEFFIHYELFALGEETGLPVQIAFAGLWTQCDREGRFRWRAQELKTLILPYHKVDMEDVLNALHRGGFIEKYERDGKFYGCIPSWDSHQVINVREAASKLPNPEESTVIQADPRGMCTHVQDSDAACARTWGMEGNGRELEWNGIGREGNVASGTRDGVSSKPPEQVVLFESKPEDPKPLTQEQQVRAVFAHYGTKHPRAFKTPNPKSKEWGKIVERLREGYSVQDLCDAIDGNHVSPFHCGQNDNRTEYHGLELIVRDGTRVNEFLAALKAHKTGPPKHSIVGEQNKNTAASYLQRTSHATGPRTGATDNDPARLGRDDRQDAQ